MEYTVRPYTSEDYDFVWDLHLKENKTYIDRHIKVTVDEIRGWFDQGLAKQDGYIIEHAGQPVGCYFIHGDDTYTKLSRFFLVDKMQGKGLGGKLLVDILTKHRTPDKPFEITVWEDNPVQEFWRKNGFVYISTDEDKLMKMIYQPQEAK